MVQVRDDSGLDLDSCLALCGSYPYASHWTHGADTCRCYSSCSSGHATDVEGGLTNEVYSHTPPINIVPGVDGIDQWTAIVSSNASASAREEIPLAFCTNVGGKSDDCVSA